jgi:hypothetical protein
MADIIVPMAPTASRIERVRLPWTALFVLLTAWCTACTKPRDPIVVSEGMLVLENQTRREWRDVRITVNDHFTGGAPSLLPGGLLTAPLRDFQTGFGQHFDRGRMSVFKVRVSATDIDGEPVALSWGK